MLIFALCREGAIHGYLMKTHKQIEQFGVFFDRGENTTGTPCQLATNCLKGMTWLSATFEISRSTAGKNVYWNQNRKGWD